MAHHFWIYRQRAEQESEAEALELGKREYRNLQPFIVSKWPGILRLRMFPAKGTGIKVWVVSDRSQKAIQRFLQRCLDDRNVVEPNARLCLEVIAANGRLLVTAQQG